MNTEEGGRHFREYYHIIIWCFRGLLLNDDFRTRLHHRDNNIYEYYVAYIGSCFNYNEEELHNRELSKRRVPPKYIAEVNVVGVSTFFIITIQKLLTSDKNVKFIFF